MSLRVKSKTIKILLSVSSSKKMGDHTMQRKIIFDLKSKPGAPDLIVLFFDPSFILSKGKYDKYATRRGIVKPLIGGLEVVCNQTPQNFVATMATIF